MQDSTEPATLNFRVRRGLAVHRERIHRRIDRDRVIRTPQTNSFGAQFGNEIVDLFPEEVLSYAHALEPTDAASAAALEALQYVPKMVDPPASTEPTRAQYELMLQYLLGRVETLEERLAMRGKK